LGGKEEKLFLFCGEGKKFKKKIYRERSGGLVRAPHAHYLPPPSFSNNKNF